MNIINHASKSFRVVNKKNLFSLSKNEYDAFIETWNIQSNKYLMKKIKRGEKQVKESGMWTYDMIYPDMDKN